MRSITPFYSGILGGFSIVAIFIVIVLSVNFSSHRIQISKVNVNTSLLSDSITSCNSDSIIQIQSRYKKQLLNELNQAKLILSPQEYTNNIVNYYNNFLMVLSVMLAGLSFLGFVYLKSQSNDLISARLNSEEFKDEVKTQLIGEAEGRYRELLSDLENKIINLEEEIILLKETSELNDSDSEIDLD
ncbi:MAG: hypothetical protein ACERKD_05915 [Prolixibacteraceae bacterium]